MEAEREAAVEEQRQSREKLVVEEPGTKFLEVNWAAFDWTQEGENLEKLSKKSLHS